MTSVSRENRVMCRVERQTSWTISSFLFFLLAWEKTHLEDFDLRIKEKEIVFQTEVVLIYGQDTSFFESLQNHYQSFGE